jgi:hypothetical protein
LVRVARELIAVGGTLPEFELFDAEGVRFVPSPSKHGIYMFARGSWCPLCMARVREIAAQCHELDSQR